MSKTNKQLINELLEEVKEKKKKDLLSIILDLGYWEQIITSNKGEEELREELAKEKEKRVVDKSGRVLSDERDLDLIKDLEERIEQITEAQTNIEKLLKMKKQIEIYYKHIANPGEDTLNKMNELSELE